MDVTVVFGFGSHPTLTFSQAELIAEKLEGLQTAAGEALARRLRGRIDGGSEPVNASAEELESLLAVLVEGRLASREQAFSELQAEAVTAFVQTGD